MIRKELIEKIRKNEIQFEEIESKFLEDKDVAIEILIIHPDLYSLFSENIRNDIDVATEVLINRNRLNVYSYKELIDENIIHLGEELQNNTPFLLDLVKEKIINKESLGMTSLKIRNNKDVIKKLLLYSYEVIDSVGDELLNNKEIVRELLTSNIGLIRNNKFKKFLCDKDFFIDLLKSDSSSVLLLKEQLPKSLANDKSFILELLDTEKGSVFYTSISERLKEDKEILLKMISKEDVPYLGFIPDKLMKDTEFVNKVLEIYEKSNILLQKHALKRNGRESLLKLLQNDEYNQLFITLYSKEPNEKLSKILLDCKEDDESIVSNLYSTHIKFKEKETLEKEISVSNIKNKKIKF